MKVVVQQCFGCGKVYEQDLYKHGIFGSSCQTKEPMISHRKQIYNDKINLKKCKDQMQSEE